MKIKNLVETDFVNYKKISMFIGFPKCDWKCCTEAGKDICQNSALAKAPDIEISYEDLYLKFVDNPLTEAVVCGGLEPFCSTEDLLGLIAYFRKHNVDCPFVIYTGYNIDELSDTTYFFLQRLGNIILKAGRFIPDQEPHYDLILGVNLASDNQRGVEIMENFKISTVENQKHVLKMHEAIRANDGYCPCRLEKTQDTKCICKEFLEQDKNGPCHCGLYVKTLL